ncbi:hypothetical protein [Streptomyces sp. NBC_00690]|uniref:hypothetical protein n=1 Tax=Streptomyces sp. NBC_00690 TaxID=2975808 RepID=UPI002E2AB19C|nr:hypothetical protein [Streptomyces sp. NBC_00690]
MNSLLVRGGVALALAGLATFAPAVAHADVSVKETQPFTGWAYENSPSKAKREAENMARRSALISGYLHEQCVLLYAYSTRLAPGYFAGDAAIRCTR